MQNFSNTLSKEIYAIAGKSVRVLINEEIK